MSADGLGAFRQQTIDDPLFAAEGLDLEQAASALDTVEKRLAEMEKVLGSGSFLKRLFFVRYPLRRFAVPGPFLRSLFESERIRREYVAHPSETNAYALLDSWRRTLEALKKSVERYTNLHEIVWSLFPKSHEPVKDTFDSLVTTRDVETTLRQLRENAAVLEREVILRAQVLSGVTRYEFRAPANYAPAVFTPGRPLVYPHLHELELAHGFGFRNSDIVERWGPIELELATFDGFPARHQFMAYELRDRESGLHSLRICSTDVYVFFRIGPGGHKGRVGNVHQALVDRGFRWWFQPANMLYATRDLVYLAQVATAVDLRRRPELDARALNAQRSGSFDLLLGSYSENLKHYRLISRDLIERQHSFPDPGFMLFYNTAPGILFLPFNASVWRLGAPLQLAGIARVSRAESTYVREREFIPQVEQAELERVMQGGRVREEVFQRSSMGA